MPRFLVLQSLEPNGLPKPFVDVPDSESVIQAATQALERLEEIRVSFLETLHNASQRRLLEYNQTDNDQFNSLGEKSRNDFRDNDGNDDNGVDGANGANDANGANGESTATSNLPQRDYPYLGPLSEALEAVDTPEEVMDLVEDATMDVIHTTLGHADPTSKEWHPPSHAQRSFGKNAWHGLLCMWLLALLLMTVGIAYGRSRRAWRRMLREHNKYL